VDGTLDKPHWREARPEWLLPATAAPGPGLDALRQRLLGVSCAFERTGDPRFLQPAERALGIQPTAFAACWTATHLLVAFQCADRDAWSPYGRRDEPLYEAEVVEVFLSPTRDVRRYYEFEVSPRGVVFDARVHSPERDRASMQVDLSWNCPGLAATVHADGAVHSRPPDQGVRLGTTRWWSAELAIPFTAFPEAGTPRPGTEWRANFYRIDRADPPEFSAWSPTGRSPADFHVPDRFGTLRFVE